MWIELHAPFTGYISLVRSFNMVDFTPPLGHMTAHAILTPKAIQSKIMGCFSGYQKKTRFTSMTERDNFATSGQWTCNVYSLGRLVIFFSLTVSYPDPMATFCSLALRPPGSCLFFFTISPPTQPLMHYEWSNVGQEQMDPTAPEISRPVPNKGHFQPQQNHTR